MLINSIILFIFLDFVSLYTLEVEQLDIVSENNPEILPNISDNNILTEELPDYSTYAGTPDPLSDEDPPVHQVEAKDTILDLFLNFTGLMPKAAPPTKNNDPTSLLLDLLLPYKAPAAQPPATSQIGTPSTTQLQGPTGILKPSPTPDKKPDLICVPDNPPTSNKNPVIRPTPLIPSKTTTPINTSSKANQTAPASFPASSLPIPPKETSSLGNPSPTPAPDIKPAPIIALPGPTLSSTPNPTSTSAQNITPGSSITLSISSAIPTLTKTQTTATTPSLNPNAPENTGNIPPKDNNNLKTKQITVSSTRTSKIHRETVVPRNVLDGVEGNSLDQEQRGSFSTTQILSIAGGIVGAFILFILIPAYVIRQRRFGRKLASLNKDLPMPPKPQPVFETKARPPAPKSKRNVAQSNEFEFYATLPTNNTMKKQNLSYVMAELQSLAPKSVLSQAQSTGYTRDVYSIRPENLFQYKTLASNTKTQYSTVSYGRESVTHLSSTRHPSFFATSPAIDNDEVKSPKYISQYSPLEEDVENWDVKSSRFNTKTFSTYDTTMGKTRNQKNNRP